jgi:hypothetical protein
MSVEYYLEHLESKSMAAEQQPYLLRRRRKTKKPAAVHPTDRILHTP